MYEAMRHQRTIMTTPSPLAAIVIAMAITVSGCVEVQWRAGATPIDYGSLQALLLLQEAKDKGLISDSTFREQRELLDSSVQ